MSSPVGFDRVPTRSETSNWRYDRRLLATGRFGCRAAVCALVALVGHRCVGWVPEMPLRFIPILWRGDGDGLSASGRFVHSGFPRGWFRRFMINSYMVTIIHLKGARELVFGVARIDA